MDAQHLVNRLINGQTYEIRTYRQHNMPTLWRQEPLFVQTHQGQVVTLTTLNTDWAEYDPRHNDVVIMNGNLHMSAEDYWMDIKISSIDPNLAEG
jgi:hypothetical protein